MLSEPFRANRGVKQGDNLSPTLFNLYVDDFLEYLHSSDTLPAYLDSMPVNHMFFADDLVLISESPSGLQHCLNALEKYCTDWQLQVNMDKTNAMIFSRKTTVKNMYGFYYKHNIVPITDQY